MANRQLGDFEIVRELGRGGMGVVYEARQVSLNRRVALKVLAAGAGLSATAVGRFHREAQAAARLHHTSIVPVYATGEADGTHFYAMELIEGPSLDGVLRRMKQGQGGEGGEPVPSAPTDLERTGPHIQGDAAGVAAELSSSVGSGGAYFDAVARMVADVADALDYAHKQTVIHRDVKPSNLLLSPEGRLSLTDFGLARLLEEPGMTVTGEFVGTPAYMSPEQITAGRVPIDHRTDIYSLGATLYELLTLQRPFSGASRDQLLAQVIQKEPPRPRAVNAQVPVDLETICLKCLEKDPDRRYRTAGELAEDLRRYVSRFAIRARRAGPLSRLKKWVKRNPALSAALAAVLVCAGSAGGLAYRSHLSERRQAGELARHEEELFDERRRGALDKAILASRVEDFDGARQAIREAERLGCSPGQIHMLQGQLEFSQGRLKEAIEHLERAVELVPANVAAWGMLGVAYLYAGRITDHHRAIREATSRPAVTPEDYLFRGHAESILDPERGLLSMEEAVRRRRSALARMIRIDVLRLNVMDTPNIEKAKTLLDEVRAIKGQLPENAVVLSMSIAAHLACYHVFGELGQPDLRQVALNEGLKDAQALERYTESPRAVTAWWLFLRDVGRGDADRLAILRRASEGLNSMYAAASYAQELYRRGEFDQAVKILARLKGQTAFDLVRVIALADAPNGLPRAKELHREIAARKLVGWDRFNSQLILRFLGRRPEAVAVSREFLTQPDLLPPVRQASFKRALEYCAGERSAESLIAAMEGKRGDLCNAHLCIALTALADGDRPTARQHLELCVQTRYFEFHPYNLSQMLLSRMGKDSKWPPWIKFKDSK